MKNNWLLTIIVSLVLAGAGFFAGLKYQESKRLTNFRNFNFQQGQRRTSEQTGFSNQRGLRPVAGEIAEIDDKSITVKLPDGSSKIIILSEKTEINKVEKTDKKDLKKGERIMVFGTESSDGSINADNIQINPAFGNRR